MQCILDIGFNSISTGSSQRGRFTGAESDYESAVVAFMVLLVRRLRWRRSSISSATVRGT